MRDNIPSLPRPSNAITHVRLSLASCDSERATDLEGRVGSKRGCDRWHRPRGRRHASTLAAGATARCLASRPQPGKSLRSCRGTDTCLCRRGAGGRLVPRRCLGAPVRLGRCSCVVAARVFFFVFVLHFISTATPATRAIVFDKVAACPRRGPHAPVLGRGAGGGWRCWRGECLGRCRWRSCSAGARCLRLPGKRRAPRAPRCCWRRRGGCGGGGASEAGLGDGGGCRAGRGEG